MIREWGRPETAGLVRVPAATDDKYTRGVVSLHTGSEAYPGAAVLGVEAAWRTGAGYVSYHGAVRELVLARRPETVVSGVGRVRAGAWVIGSGADSASRTEREQGELTEILAGTVPVVVDAGALDLVGAATAPMVLTPHRREFATLRARLGLPPSQATGDGDAAEVVEVSRLVGAVILRKGASTLVASPEGEVLRVTNGPGWLATAGTGDVLAGVLGALLAANPGRDLAQVAAGGAWLHGEAATIASGSRDAAPGHPIVALDVAEALPLAVGSLLA